MKHETVHAIDPKAKWYNYVVMKSKRNALASAVILAALPAAVAIGALFGIEPETVLHLEFAIGCGLLRSGVLGETNWLQRLGTFARTALSFTFFLQFAAQVIRNDVISRIAFEVLGQWPESCFIGLLLVWFIGMLAAGPKSWSTILGCICVVPAAVSMVLHFVRPLFGSTNPDAFKLFLLAPFVWLLIESSKQTATDMSNADLPE